MLYYAGSLHTRLVVTQGGTMNRDTGVVTPYMTVPAGMVIAHDKDTAAINLVHRGGRYRALTGVGEATEKQRRASAPDYVEDDGRLYCASGDMAHHTHLFSEGEITSSK